MPTNEATPRPWEFHDMHGSYWVGHFPNGENKPADFVGGWSFTHKEDKDFAETAVNKYDDLVKALRKISKLRVNLPRAAITAKDSRAWEIAHSDRFQKVREIAAAALATEGK